MVLALKRFGYLLGFFIFFFSIKSSELELSDLSFAVLVDFDKDTDFHELKQSLTQLPERFELNTLQFITDSYIETSERDYILGFTQGSTIAAQDLINACKNLKKKNKFSHLSLTLSIQQGVAHIIMDLISVWTFKRVIVRGLMRDSEKYRHYYLLEFGEPFNRDKHNHSLEKIRAAFSDGGFFKGEVIDYLSYDQKTKSVTVTLVVDTGYQFIIDATGLICTMAETDACPSEKFVKKLDELIKSHLQGNYFSQALLTDTIQILKQYLAKKGYLNAGVKVAKECDYNNECVKLLFTVTVHKKKAIAFFGNHFFSHTQLFDNVYAFGKSMAFLPDSFLVQEIIDAYQKKGFWHIEVDCKKEKKRTYFLIKEGQRSVIENVEISGNSAIDNKKIKSFFKDFLKQPFDEDLLRLCLQKVINYYLSQGFLTVTIGEQKYSQGKKTGHYTLYITLTEGEKYYLKSVCVEQFSSLSSQLPCAPSSLSKTPFDASIIQQQREWLMNYFQKQGYLYVDAKHEIIYEATDMHIVWRIAGIDKKVTFGKITVLGSHTFPFECITRELSFKEGDIWQKEKLDDSLKCLRRLGVFETIYIYPYNISEQEEQKAILIKLLEDDPFEVRIRAGFQQVSKTLLEFRKGTTYKLGGTFLYKNPFNVGDYFCVDTDFTRFYRNISVEYQRPWFFSMPLNTVIKGYSNKYIQPVHTGSDKRLYQAIQQGFLIGVNRCCDHVNFGCNIGVELMETDKLSAQMARAINFETVLIDKKVPYVYTEPNIVIDYLDNDVNPTYGTLTVIACKSMIPTVHIKSATFNKLFFIKILFEQSIFTPLSWISSVFGVRFRVGHIFNQKFNNIMPPERFYLGGQNSIRSYEPDLGPPLGSFVNDDGKKVLVPQGGKSMFNMNFEIRFPLIWNIGGVIFQDMGFLADHSLTEVISSHLLAGTGFGLRYYTPVGPLRFDIGWKWKRYAPEESWYAWFLTLGHAF